MTSDHTLDRSALAPTAPMHDAIPSLHLETTVTEVLRLLPYGRVVLGAFNVDATRGGSRTIAEAARAADLEPAVLLDALQSTICPSFGAVRADGASWRAR